MPLSAAEIYQLHLDWAAKQNREGQAKELDPSRLGKLRGGSVGCLGPKGEVYGTCPRAALARSWGYNGDENDLAQELMFHGGRVNEIACDETFKEMLGDDAIIPEGDSRSIVSWDLPDGRNVGGSPDAILTKPEGKLLLEYKKICSTWTARSVSIKLTPKKSHIIQAAHYLGASGLTHGILYYRQEVNFTCPGVFGMAPASLWPEDSPIVQYEGEEPLKVIPHVSLYDLLLDDKGMLWIRHHSQKDYRPTLVSTQGIFDFYKRVSDQESGQFLADKPVRKYPTVGKTDKGDNHSACEYCDLKAVCADKSIGFVDFKKQVESKIRR